MGLKESWAEQSAIWFYTAAATGRPESFIIPMPIEIGEGPELMIDGKPYGEDMGLGSNSLT